MVLADPGQGAACKYYEKRRKYDEFRNGVCSPLCHHLPMTNVTPQNRIKKESVSALPSNPTGPVAHEKLQAKKYRQKLPVYKERIIARWLQSHR